MADTKDAPVQKAESKAGRRTSFARALHVPAIARRVKQFESAGTENKDAPNPAPSRPRDGEDKAPERKPSPKPSSVSTTVREVGQQEDDVGGAEIPDIPLRRSSNLRSLGTELGVSSLATLERMLAAGGMQQDPHPTGPFNSFRLRAEKRYEGQCEEMSLYPVSERSWESSSLPGVPEVSPEPSLRRDTSSSPNLQQRDWPALSPRRDTALAPFDEQSVDLPTSPVNLRPSTPYDGKTPQSKLASSPSASLTATSFQTEQTEQSLALPPLQAKGADDRDALNPVEEEDSDPNNFDLLVPPAKFGIYSLERRSELLYSVEHLRVIFSDPIFLHRFTAFIHLHRPHSVPLLNYTLDALKAIRAMDYMNQIISQSLRFDDLQSQPPRDFAAKAAPELTNNTSLRQKTMAAFEALARDELPAYITHVWVDIVEVSMKRKISGTMPAHLQDLSDGLAEVFCITDPSRADNPIVFASEEFHRTTQYGPDYVLGRNCRFLQGPKTNPFSIRRIQEKLKEGKEHYETILNYRRDGLPFMNLLMCTPLLDSMGQIRYYLGAQIDVSGLAKDCSGLESLRRLVDQDEEEQLRRQEDGDTDTDATTRHDSGADVDLDAVGTATTTSSVKHPTRSTDQKDKLRLLTEMFSRSELETVRRFGGRMHRSQQEQGQHLEAISNWHKPRMVLHDQYEPSPPSSPPQGFGSGGRQGFELSDANGNITLSIPSPPPPFFSSGNSSSFGPRPPAIFENYLVVRPHPSLRILFASPSLRVPGTLQSHLMSRIGGSKRIHEELDNAFAMGQSVTAKVKWIPSSGLRSTTSSGALPDNSSGSTGGATATTASHESVGMEGRPRWIHCTPLLGSNGSVGVWIVVIVDDDSESSSEGNRRRKREASVGVLPGRQGSTSWRGGPVSGMLSKSADEMSLADYASMSRLPDDEELRRHVRDMYEETRRRERTPSSVREWERGWNESRGEDERDAQRSEFRVKVNGGNGGGGGGTLKSGNGAGAGAGAGGVGFGFGSGKAHGRTGERFLARESRMGDVSVKGSPKSPEKENNQRQKGEEPAAVTAAKKLGYL